MIRVEQSLPTNHGFVSKRVSFFDSFVNSFWDDVKFTYNSLIVIIFSDFDRYCFLKKYKPG